MLLAAPLLVVTSSATAAEDSQRIEGLITAVHRNDFVLSSDGRQFVGDVSSLGGVTAAIAAGQRIAVIGTMAPGGQTFHAIRLESATKEAVTRPNASGHRRYPQIPQRQSASHPRRAGAAQEVAEARAH
jgi:hypothetical protein